MNYNNVYIAHTSMVLRLWRSAGARILDTTFWKIAHFQVKASSSCCLTHWQ